MNAPEQIESPKPLVNQWAQVRTCLRLTLSWGFTGYFTFSLLRGLFGGVNFVGNWLLPDQFFYRLGRLHSTDGNYYGTPQMFGPLAWWLTGFFILFWIFRFGSIASKLAMISCAALGMGMITVADQLAHQMDFTERRLDVSRSGFEPGMVILAGTVKQLNHTEPEGTFEIRIAGPDHYYIHQSWPDTWHYQESSYTEIATPRWAGWNGRDPRRRDMTPRTHCGGRPTKLEILDTEQVLMPGRGLWEGPTFTGAKEEGQTVDYSPLKPNPFWHKNRHEEYFRLERIGRWLIPREIVFHCDGRFQDWVFTVRRIELLALPEHGWFEKIKAKHFSPEQFRWKIRDGQFISHVREGSAPAPPAPPPGR